MWHFNEGNMQRVQPLGQFARTPLKNNKVWCEPCNGLGIGLDVAADFGELLDFGRKIAELRDSDDPVADTQRKECFGDAGCSRHNALRLCLRPSLRP